MNTEQANETIRRGYRALWNRPFEVLPGQPGITVYTKEADEVLEFAEVHGLAFPIFPTIGEWEKAFIDFAEKAEKAGAAMSRVFVGMDLGAGDDRTVYREVE